MSVVLATLCLNEMEFLPSLYQQHKDWPGLTKWVFVESADAVYAKTNPTLVSAKGLSVDGTTEWLESLSRKDDRVVHVRYGLSTNTNPAQGKVESRQQCLNVANQYSPNYVFVLDADEFYTKAHQKVINAHGNRVMGHGGIIFKQRHLWRPPSIYKLPMFQLEVVGAYWNVPHCRFWYWHNGMYYADNHNTPQDSQGRSLGINLKRMEQDPNAPQCIHLGFASLGNLRAAKHQYYVARGEGPKDGRQMYVDCRRAFETWKLYDELPHKAKVIQYNGPIPEVFNVQE